MKKIFQLMFLGILLFYSCEDVLKEDPKSFLTPESFPKTEKDAIAATTAAYSRLYLNQELYIGFVGTDEAFQGAHNKRPISWFKNLTEFDNDANLFWKTDYEGIVRCNTVIDAVPPIEMDTDLKERLVGEAKFLRAFYYFQLVRKFGGVPIIDAVIKDPSELEGVTRNTVEEVYALIKKDLEAATAVLPTSYGQGEKGRVTKWAAVGILAKVHMTLHEFQPADELLSQIINSGDFGLFADYNKNFGVVNEGKMFPDKNGNLVNEIIWDVQFAVDDRPNGITTSSGSRDKQVGGPTNHWGGFENMLPTHEFREFFEEGDLRLPISYVTEVISNGVPNVLVSTKTPGAGPISGKYHNPDSGVLPLRVNSGNNINVLRYSDVLLLKAETLNELGKTAEAHQYINLVRERAGISLLEGLDQQSMTTSIRKERSTELSFEGHRRYDLLRWGIFVETVRNTTSSYLQVPRESIQDFHVLLPIPQNEIGASNGSITQNPGY